MLARAAAPAMQPAEVQFARRLAAPEKGVRDRAVKRLRQYISARTQREAGGFSPEELLKIWRGLVHCLRVQDAPLLQEELALALSRLVRVVRNPEAQRLFLRTFWRTLAREWPAIEAPHRDRFRTLLRLVLRQSLDVLQRPCWDESHAQLFLDLSLREVLRPENQPPGRPGPHLADVYLEELSQLLAERSHRVHPSCAAAAERSSPTPAQTIARAVCEALVRRAPRAPGGTAAARRAEVGGADPAGWAVGAQGAGLSPVGGDGPHGGGARGTGSSRDAGPPVQLDPRAAATWLLELTGGKDTPPASRRRLSKLVRRFQDLSAGQARGGAPAAAEDPGGTQEEEERQGTVPGKRRKKRKQGHPQPPPSGPGVPDEGGQPEAVLDGAREAGVRDPQLCPGHPPATQRKRPGKRARGPSPDAPAAAPPPDSRQGTPGSSPSRGPAGPGPPARGAPLPKRPRRPGSPQAQPQPPREGAPGGPGDGAPCRHPPPPGGKLKRKKGEPGPLALRAPPGCKSALLRKRKQGPSGPLSPSKRSRPSAEDDFVRFAAPSVPKALFFRRARSAPARPPRPAVQLHKTPPGSKRVTFGLSRNMTAEFRKTDRSLLVSPAGLSRVAFHPERRPLHGVLKTPTRSPASTLLGARKPPPGPLRSRPRAVDFF